MVATRRTLYEDLAIEERAVPSGDPVAVAALLGEGAGRLVLELAKAQGMTVREAGSALLADRHWDELP